MSRFYNLDQAPFNSRALSTAIVTAISGQYNGAYFDAQDLSTMFQDAAGTVPVTAMEQPVGKIIDKSGNGNHATQPITASRPTLSARYNLFTKTEDFSNAAWFKSNVSFSAGLPSPFGNIATKIISTSTTAIHRFYQPVSVGLGVKSYVCAVKAGEYTTVELQITDNVSGDFRAVINLMTGVVGPIATTGRWSATSIVTKPLSDGWFLIIATGTNNTNPLTLPLFYVKDSTSYAGDNTSGVYVCAPDLRLGTTSGPYQRVNTATDYDTNPRYFPKYLRFDGVDDYLNLPYMWLYGGGAASIIAARDAVSQATDTYIISERSSSSASPKYFPSRQLASGGNMDTYISDDAAAVVLDTTGSAFSGASDKVIRSVVDTGNNIKLFKNGALAANDNYTRSGTLTLTNTTIGASVSTTTSNYANMKLYGLAITKSALSDSERRRVERLLAYNSGAQI